VKVFLDTNVIISAFMGRGLSHDVYRLVKEYHEPITGEAVLEELRRVLSKKFEVSQRDLDDMLMSFGNWHVEPRPEALPMIRIRDRDDLPILASALASSADVLVTGDKDLLELTDQISELKIMDPRGFWNLHHGSDEASLKG